ncbi:UNVERIFIED_CONTAM: Ekn1, related protein, putative [Hammondia hammondi]|eukprot:XP_008888169.1 Ekn1, related protein, putative [Hammondia hammondi]
MPVPVKFEWSETSDTVAFALCIPVLSSCHTPEVRRIISPLYIRISAPPYFFEVDLFDEIDDETVDASLSGAQLLLRLRKKKSGIWKAFCATDHPEITKETLLARREASIKTYERKQQERRQQLKERKYDKRKSAQEEQWRLDSGARQWLESQADSEKLQALHTLYNVADNQEEPAYSRKEATKDSHPPVASVSLLHARSINEGRTAAKAFQVKGGVAGRSPERPVEVQGVQNRKHDFSVPKTFILDVESRPQAALEEHDLSDRSSREECSTPGECRLDDSAPEKNRITLTFTTRRRQRLPARGNKMPPFPKDVQHLSTIQPLMDGRALREGNSEWLKQKGDSMLKNGDLRSAIEAYSASLKLADSARCFCNRGYCHLLLGEVDKVRRKTQSIFENRESASELTFVDASVCADTPG